MITFKRDGSKLTVSIESGLAPQSNVYILNWECSDQCYADLLLQHLQTKLGDKLSSIRREAYEKGFDDHKKRKQKEDWFRRNF